MKKLIFISAFFIGFNCLASDIRHVETGPIYEKMDDIHELERALSCQASQKAYEKCFWEAINEFKDQISKEYDWKRIIPPTIGVKGPPNINNGIFFEIPPASSNFEQARIHFSFYMNQPRLPARPSRLHGIHVEHYTNGLPSLWYMDGFNANNIYTNNTTGFIMVCPQRVNGEIDDDFTSPYITTRAINIWPSKFYLFNQNGSQIFFRFCTDPGF